MADRGNIGRLCGTLSGSGLAFALPAHAFTSTIPAAPSGYSFALAPLSFSSVSTGGNASRQVQGTVTKNDAIVARLVRAYDRRSGALRAQTRSAAGSGFFSLTIPSSEPVFIVVHDDATEAAPLNAQVRDFM